MRLIDKKVIYKIEVREQQTSCHTRGGWSVDEVGDENLLFVIITTSFNVRTNYFSFFFLVRHERIFRYTRPIRIANRTCGDNKEV